MRKKNLLIFHAEKIKFQNIPKDLFTFASHNFFLGKKNGFENFGNFKNNITYFQSCQGRELFCDEIC
jgi:hypothetical protein